MPESSFRIEGNSSSFHITWSPTKVEWGTTFYCVGSKALQVRTLMQSLPIIYLYHYIYLLIYLFLKRNRVCFFSSIYKLVKNQTKLQTECKLSSFSIPATSSGSGLAAGAWRARRGVHSDQRFVRRPLTVTQKQKGPLRWQWDSLRLNVKSSLHPPLTLVHLASFSLNSKGRWLAHCYTSLQCHRSWWNNDHSQEEKLCFDLVNQFDEGIFRNWRPFWAGKESSFILFYFVPLAVSGEWRMPPSP